MASVAHRSIVFSLLSNLKKEEKTKNGLTVDTLMKRINAFPGNRVPTTPEEVRDLLEEMEGEGLLSCVDDELNVAHYMLNSIGEEVARREMA